MYFDLRKEIELLYHHRKIWDDLLSLKFEDVRDFSGGDIVPHSYCSSGRQQTVQIAWRCETPWSVGIVKLAELPGFGGRITREKLCLLPNRNAIPIFPVHLIFPPFSAATLTSLFLFLFSTSIFPFLQIQCDKAWPRSSLQLYTVISE